MWLLLGWNKNPHTQIEHLGSRWPLILALPKHPLKMDQYVCLSPLNKLAFLNASLNASLNAYTLVKTIIKG